MEAQSAKNKPQAGYNPANNPAQNARHIFTSLLLNILKYLDTISTPVFIERLQSRMCFEFSRKWIICSTGIRAKPPRLELVSLGINVTSWHSKFSLKFKTIKTLNWKVCKFQEGPHKVLHLKKNRKRRKKERIEAFCSPN